MASLDLQPICFEPYHFPAYLRQPGRASSRVRARITLESSQLSDGKEGFTVDTPTSVDGNAPVLAHHEIDISAPVSRVWALHQDVNAWPTWQSDITAAHLNGAFAPGESFTWTSFGFTVTSTVYAVQDQARVLWGGTGDGITGVHEWIFTATPAGTHVETTESFAGAPVEADVAGMQRVLDGSLVSWLNHLKNAAQAPVPD
jgi:hypothetical protein